MLGDGLLDPELTRAPLAAAVDAFVQSEANGTGLTSEMLAADGELYDDLSLDEGPLYPPGAATPFDTQAPVVTFDPVPDPEVWRGQVFSVSVAAQDKSLPVTFALDVVGEPTSATNNSATWEVAPAAFEDGPVDLVVTATDAAGNAGQASTKVLLDSTPPVIEVGPLQTWAPSTEVTLAVEVTDPASGVETVKVEVGPSLVDATPTDDANEYAAAVSLPNVTGSNAVSVKAWDVAGNGSSLPVTVSVDATAPLVTDVTPNAGTPVRSTAPLEVTGQVTGGPSGVAAVELSAGGDPVEVAPEAATFAGSVQVTAEADATTLSVRARSGAGVWSDPLEIALVVDDAPPTWTAIELGAEVEGVHYVPTLSNQPLTLVGLQDEGPANALEAKGTITIEGDASAEPTPFGPPGDTTLTLNIDQTPGTVTVQVTDTAGNAAPPTTVEVALDDEGPELTLTSHKNADWVATTELTLAGTIQDVVPIETLTVETGGQTFEATIAEDNTWTCPTTLLVDTGPNELKVKAVDTLGNPSWIDLTLNVDQTEPVLEILTPGANQPVQSGDVTIAAVAHESGAPIVAITWQLDDGPPLAYVPDSPTDEVPSWPMSDTFPVPAGDGERTFTVIATNAAGLESKTEQKRKFTVDDTPPTGAVLSFGTPVDGIAWLTSNTAQLELTFFDTPTNFVTTKGFATLSGAATGEFPLEGGDNTLTFTIDTPTEPLTIALKDAAGNAATSTIVQTVAIDTTPPEVTILTPIPHEDGQVWTNQDNIELVIDAIENEGGVGIAQVLVNSVQATPADTKWTASVPLTTPYQELTVTAQDKLGRWSAPALLKVRKDKTAPSLDLLPSQYTAETAALVTDPCASPEQTTAGVQSAINTFTVADGLEIDRLAHRMNGVNGTPIFIFGVKDDGDAGLAGQVAVSYRFQRGVIVLAEGVLEPAATVEIPLTAATFAPGGLVWTPDSFPDALVVEGEDLAGNTASATIPFELRVHGPPPCVVTDHRSLSGRPDRPSSLRGWGRSRSNATRDHLQSLPGATAIHARSARSSRGLPNRETSRDSDEPGRWVQLGRL